MSFIETNFDIDSLQSSLKTLRYSTGAKIKLTFVLGAVLTIIGAITTIYTLLYVGVVFCGISFIVLIASMISALID